MFDLFRSELRRFGRYAVLAAVVHLFALLFVNRMTNLLQQPYFDAMLLLDFYMLVGLAFGLVQAGSYRKPSQWLWLIHRPLPPRRIFAALATSATTVLAIALLLPQLVFVAGFDLFTTHVVDLRHYMTPLYVLVFATMAWLAGCHAILSRHKVAIAVLAMPLMLGLHLVSVAWLLLPAGICLAWMTYVAMHGFRADREAPVKPAPALLATALPLQLGFFVLIVAIGKTLFVAGGMVLGVDPLNTSYPPEGGLIEIQRKEPADALILGLAGSSDPRAASWREQLPLLEPVGISAWLTRFPIRQQLSNLNVPTQWFDERRNTFWTFSHDRMLFHGRDPKSGADRGWWGLGGAGDTTRFTEVPFVSLDGDIVTRRELYAIDEDTQRQHRLLELPAGEWFVSLPTRALDRVFVITNRRVVAYRADRTATSAFAPPLVDFALALPAGTDHIEGAQVARLMDGWLVSFVYGDGMRTLGFAQFGSAVEPWQRVVFVDETGAATTVGERAIRRDYPALYQVSWWVSPPLHVLSELPDSALEKALSVPLRPEVWPRAREFQVAAILLALASLALAAWWLRGANVTPQRRRLWLATCALFSLPAFLSLVCLEPRGAR